MTLSAVGPGGTLSPPSEAQQRSQLLRIHYKNLEQSLTAGDLPAAQKAYDAILAQSGGGASPAFAALGSALRTADLSVARDALQAVHAHAHAASASPTVAPPSTAGGLDLTA